MGRIAVLIFLMLNGFAVIAQDTLPRFTAVSRGMNKNMISWTNPFSYVSQINIQRSSDSLRNFQSIISIPDPSIPQNGFVDIKAPAGVSFYRLFIVLDSGKYQFTKSRRAVPDTATATSESVLNNDNQRVVLSDSLSRKDLNVIREKLQQVNNAANKNEKYFIVKRKDQIVDIISQKYVQKFRDSLIFSTRDTMIFAAVDTILIKPFIPKEMYRSSRYVYTERYGNVVISLPDANSKKYSIRFFEEDGSALFEIERIQSTSITLDKTNFVHSGWFLFELYDEGRLKEKHRFYIPRDF